MSEKRKKVGEKGSDAYRGKGIYNGFKVIIGIFDVEKNSFSIGAWGNT